MNRRQVVLLALLAGAAALVIGLATRTRQAPLVPRDDVHATGGPTAACLACHGPGGTTPRGPDHPLGDDCLRCHGS